MEIEEKLLLINPDYEVGTSQLCGETWPLKYDAILNKEGSGEPLLCRLADLLPVASLTDIFFDIFNGDISLVLTGI